MLIIKTLFRQHKTKNNILSKNFLRFKNKHKNLIKLDIYSFTVNKTNTSNDLKFENLKKDQIDNNKNKNFTNQIKVNFDDIKNDKDNELLGSTRTLDQKKRYSTSIDKNNPKNTNRNEYMNFDKSKTNNDVVSNSDDSNLVLIYSQQTGMKYYIYNSLFLTGYVIYFWLNIFKEIPEPLYSTILMFGSITHVMLIGLFMLSNRQIKNIYMKRNSKLLIVETFSILKIKKKTYLLETDKIKEVRSNPLMKKMNLFYIVYNKKFGFFKLFDYFIFRPTSNTSQMFDNIFKSKILKK